VTPRQRASDAERAAGDAGCRTASLQATEMAHRRYRALGFRDLGRILEYVPACELSLPPRARAGG